MYDFSIEQAAQGIYDTRTKRYFAEVEGCYHAGHYRSAVVMLWSVVITDIMLKLEQLSAAYSDPTATAILSDVEKMRLANPKSPDWENALIERVSKNTQLICQTELLSLQQLQAHRHLCAHPIITNNEILYSPSKDLARALIRQALEAVLAKPPFMSRRAFDAMMIDIEEYSRLRPDGKDIGKYLEAKYFARFTSTTFQSVFRSLWRVAFHSKDPRSAAIRDLLVKTLCAMFLRNTHGMLTYIKNDWRSFSDVNAAEESLACLAEFCREFPQVYPVLGDDAKTLLAGFAGRDRDNLLLCGFLYQAPEQHATALLATLQPNKGAAPQLSNSGAAALGEYIKRFPPSDTKKDLLRIGIDLYHQSGSFDTADSRFWCLVQPFAPEYTLDDFRRLFAGCDNCFRGQSIGRRRAKVEHAQIWESAKKLHPDLRLSDFPAFADSIK